MTLAALLQLSSATLPVGAFSYSQGLEWAVEAGWVTDERSAGDWIECVVVEGIARTEAVIVARTMQALSDGDWSDLERINTRCLASRETRELLADTLQMGRSMHRLLVTDGRVDAAVLQVLHRLEECDGVCFPLTWAVAAHARGVDAQAALIGYGYAALENLVLAAVKTVPLGQSAGQRLLGHIGQRLPALAQAALDCPLDHLTNFLPGQVLASMHHEHQHTRLFRS